MSCSKNNGKVLFTIGYEMLNQDIFIEKLSNNNINLLIDIREVPISRKTGFSKKKLMELVNNAGIEYVHFPELGSPKKARNNLHATGNFEAFSEEYMEHLKTHDVAYEKINLIMDFLKTKRCCMLCFEKRPDKCHRRLLAAKIKKSMKGPLEVIDL